MSFRPKDQIGGISSLGLETPLIWSFLLENSRKPTADFRWSLAAPLMDHMGYTNKLKSTYLGFLENWYQDQASFEDYFQTLFNALNNHLGNHHLYLKNS